MKDAEQVAKQKLSQKGSAYVPQDGKVVKDKVEEFNAEKQNEKAQNK